MNNIACIILSRPATLTPERAYAVLPSFEIDPEWQRKEEQGELPDGFLRIAGMLRKVPSGVNLTADEARWILALREHMSWRALAGEVFGNENQIIGIQIEEAALNVLLP